MIPANWARSLPRHDLGGIRLGFRNDSRPVRRHPFDRSLGRGRRPIATVDGVSTGAPATAAVAAGPPQAHAHPSATFAGAVMARSSSIWGLGPPVTKLITAPALVSVSMRFWVSVPDRAGPSPTPRGGGCHAGVLRRTALAGALFGINLAFVFSALQHTSVAVLVGDPDAAARASCCWWPGAGWASGPPAGTSAGPAVGVLGVVVVILGGNAEVRGDALGVVFGVASMLTFTAYYLINRRVRFDRRHRPDRVDGRRHAVRRPGHHPVALATSSPDDYRQLAGADWLYLPSSPASSASSATR